MTELNESRVRGLFSKAAHYDEDMAALKAGGTANPAFVQTLAELDGLSIRHPYQGGLHFSVKE